MLTASIKSQDKKDKYCQNSSSKRKPSIRFCLGESREYDEKLDQLLNRLDKNQKPDKQSMNITKKRRLNPYKRDKENYLKLLRGIMPRNAKIGQDNELEVGGENEKLVKSMNLCFSLCNNQKRQVGYTSIDIGNLMNFEGSENQFVKSAIMINDYNQDNLGLNPNSQDQTQSHNNKNLQFLIPPKQKDPGTTDKKMLIGLNIDKKSQSQGQILRSKKELEQESLLKQQKTKEELKNITISPKKQSKTSQHNETQITKEQSDTTKIKGKSASVSIDENRWDIS